MAKTSPTQRSLKFLRDSGYTAWVAERWNSFAKIRQDLGGFGDIIAWKAGVGIVAVQTTTRAHQANRAAKILTDPKVKPKAEEWVRAGGRIAVHGWAKVKLRRGGLATRWELSFRELDLAAFHPPTEPEPESPPTEGGIDDSDVPF